MKIITFCKNNTLFHLFISGLATSLIFAPTYLIFIIFFTLPYLMENIINSSSYKEVIKKSFLFFLGYFIGGFYWISGSLLVEPLLYGWLIPFALTIIPGIMALYFVLISVLLFNFSKTIKNKFILSIMFSAMWIIAEFIRGPYFTQFPWNNIITSITMNSIFLQPVSVLNIFGYGFLLLILYNCKFFYKENKKSFYSVIAIFCILFGFSIARVMTAKKEYLPYNIRIVQPNIEQSVKWDEDFMIKNFNNTIELTKSEGIDKIDYIIWPEMGIQEMLNMNYISTYRKINTFPFMFNNDFLLSINNNLLNDKQTLISGIGIIEYKNMYNSMIVLKKDNIHSYYHKYGLVPFGEFIPFRNLLFFMKKITNGTTDFSRGTKQFILKDENLKNIAPLICYESIFYDLINKDSNLIINITNDSWFGNSTGPYQHFSNLKLRAVENNIPALRVGNSGISGVINSLGQVEHKLKLNETGFLDVKIPNIKTFTIKKINEIYTIFTLLAFVILIRVKYVF